MLKSLLLAILVVSGTCLYGQGFEIAPIQESYKGLIGETIKVPLRFKNNSDKPISLIIRKVTEQIGSTQKKYFCIDNNCLDSKVEEYVLKVEPGQLVNNFYVALDAGLNRNESMLRYLAFNKANPNQFMEVDLNFEVEEKPDKATVYTSRYVTVYDIYPNPAVEEAFVDYDLANDNVNAKILVHNILGNIIGEYALSAMEKRVRIKIEDQSAGIYFYTLYVENEGVMTRKLIVKK